MSQSFFFTQDPQSNIVLHRQEGTCTVLFDVWDGQGEALPGQQGRIRFTDCWAGEYVALSAPEGPEHREPCIPNAFLWQTTASPWLAEKIATRLRQYPTWLDWDRQTYWHYIVEGHDNYCHIIATGFKLDLVPMEPTLHG